MKYPAFLIVCLLFTICNNAQQIQPVYPDSLFPTYYHQRASLFRVLPKTDDDIIFLGNSITDGGEWSELFADSRIKNRGISGDNTIGVLNRLDEVYNRKPAMVFLLIGTNDLARNMAADTVVKNICRIASLIKQFSPHTKLFVQSIFPLNERFGKFSGHMSKKNEIIEVNRQLRSYAPEYKYRYVDVFAALADSSGRLNTAYTNDGLHLTGAGYLRWKECITPLLYSYPALIPLPASVQWINKKVSLSRFSSLVIDGSSLEKEAILVRDLFARHKLPMKVSKQPATGTLYIHIHQTLDIPDDEGYELTVTPDKIIIRCRKAAGAFYAIQTLKQLITEKQLQCAVIRDAPAFGFRGFMVDVGRNYQSVRQLKQQIDIMALYKLNIFHFHLTEDIAWRLESKQYPQLTAAKNMHRNPGKYYSYRELKELIAYCKDRHITLIPEIDMPGHSAAFKRAMGVDMQSEAGMKICRNILQELCKETDLPYIHIGGDEVKITNKSFLPEMVALLRSLGKKVIAWDPGGNVPAGTLVQLWNGNTVTKENFPAIDSRHLYLNHFDPLDGVVATFNHQVCDVTTGSSDHLGATLCNWPDRNVSKEEDLIRMNAVYPVMLSFSERCWRGGGWKNYLSDMGQYGQLRHAEFSEFEERLIEHQHRFFHTLPFPYTRQSHLEWRMIGPFTNNGNTRMVFPPESAGFMDTVQLKHYPTLIGGTIWLRHFWNPMIGSHLSDPQDSTTYYSLRKVWSDTDGYKKYWIGFNNLSRSTATDSPPIDAWDEKGSAVWVNGVKVAAPAWKRAGQKGDPEIPLTDEGYEYRDPVNIYLHKGWNDILIKSPVGSFKGKDWQNPVKWMFTMVEAGQQ